MMKHLSRTIFSCLISLCVASTALSQVPAPPPGPADSAASSGPPAAAEKTAPNPVPAFVLCFLSTILVLFIICKPSRKE
jgi:hypothetical protein